MKKRVLFDNWVSIDLFAIEFISHSIVFFFHENQPMVFLIMTFQPSKQQRMGEARNLTSNNDLLILVGSLV
jgi:hypothetical protein